MQSLTEQFVVGIVRGSHGLSGEFKVESTSGEYEHFGRIKEVTLTDGTEQRVFKVEYTKDSSVTLYMKLIGIDTPEDALAFNGWRIVVPREYAHPLKEGEWYIEDLKGCSVWYEEVAPLSAPVVLSDDNTIGTVTDVVEGGAGYLVEILLSESCTKLTDEVKFTKRGKIRTVYVPFKNDFIGAVDVNERKMQLMHLWILE